MNIFVTGGTGFLGEHLIPLLTKNGQHTVSALARSDRSAQALTTLGAKPIHADLTDAPALEKALADQPIDIVFHMAAEIASQRSKAKLKEANIDGTQNLYDALKNRNTLQRFIFVSTVVTGEANGNLLEESTPLNVETEYGRTKQWGETMLLKAFHENEFPALVVRPCHIYGNGGWYGEVIQRMQKGQMRIPGDGQNWWDVIHVDDVASALITVMDKGQPGQIYHACDGHPVTMNDFVEKTAQLANVKAPGTIPRWLANVLLGKDTTTSVTRSARTDNTKLKELGWQPQYPNFDIGLTQTFAEIKK